jgi:hypothetical protein
MSSGLYNCYEFASLLSVFDIKKGNNTNGRPDNYPFTGSGLTLSCLINAMGENRRADHWCFLPSRPRPGPFAYSINPRDRNAEELILADSRVP